MASGDTTIPLRDAELHRTGGILVLIGVLGLLLQQALDTRLPPGPSGPGDVTGFVARATHSIWVPYQVAELVGVLLVTLGLFYLYGSLVARGEVRLTIAWLFAATLAAGVRVVEFTLGVIALPSLNATFGTGLSQTQLLALIQGYMAFGAGLLVIIAVFTGATIALLGAALYRARLFHPFIGASGVVLGLYLFIAKIIPGSMLTLSPLDTITTVLVWLWLIAIGASMIRTESRPE